MTNGIKAGSSQIDITPKDSQFLFGYPHVERMSTGVHDPLLSSALYLENGKEKVLFIANDIVFVDKELTRKTRSRIEQASGVRSDAIMISATHTHSGPKTLDYLSNEGDPVVPKTDRAYVKFLEDQIVQAACQAVEQAQPAQVGLAVADGTGVGTNRRDPSGPCDLEVPVLLVKSQDGQKHIACMMICAMHPTVLHEDSTLISGDFPGMTRQFLQREILGGDCPVIYHTGASGNQSPRHVTQANTFAEAKRLGDLLGQSIALAISSMAFHSESELSCIQSEVPLPGKPFPSVATAEQKLDSAISRLENLRENSAPRQDVRTAECDWFGAEETLTFARASEEGRLEAEYESCLPAEIQIIKVGDWAFVAWPGELFVEYALQIRAKRDNTFVLTMANGDLKGYVVTPEAAAEGGYEASNALLSYESGQIIVDQTFKMLETLNSGT
jgi:hypothetical protein